jgi:hypothetical protein
LSLDHRLGVVAHKAAIDASFDTFDVDRSGELDYRELDRQLHRRVSDPSYRSVGHGVKRRAVSASASRPQLTRSFSMGMAN